MTDIRSDGLSAHTVGMAMVFAQPVSESDAGLYTCRALRYNHNATVTVLVEVTSRETHSSKYLPLYSIMAIVAYKPLECLYSGYTNLRKGVIQGLLIVLNMS